MKPHEARFDIPEKEPYEGKATQKQKQKLWELGIQDRDIIDNLGKKQASYLIGRSLQTHRDRGNSQSSSRMVVFGFVILAAAVLFLFHIRGSNQDGDGTMLLAIMGLLLGPLLIVWGGIKSLYYKIKLRAGSDY